MRSNSPSSNCAVGPKFRKLLDESVRTTVIATAATSPTETISREPSVDSLASRRAAALVGRMLAAAPADDRPRIDWLFQRLYGRPPAESELESGLATLVATLADHQGKPDAERLTWEEYGLRLLCANAMRNLD